MAKRFTKAGTLGRHYLAEWREHRGISVTDMAARLGNPRIGNGIDRVNLYHVERYQRPYSQDLVEAYAKVLRVSVSDLLGRAP